MSSQSKTKIETRKPFEESLHGLLYDIFRRVGINIPVNKIDMFRSTIKKIAILIVTETKLVTLREVSELQKRVKGAINQVGIHLVDLEKRSNNLEDRLEVLEDKLKIRSNTLKVNELDKQ